MIRMLRWISAAAVLLVAPVTAAAAQSADVLGTRATGMGGAFVAVSDDASAVYWNPAGFASGSFFSLVVDRNSDEVGPQTDGPGRSRSALIVALGAPALGL